MGKGIKIKILALFYWYLTSWLGYYNAKVSTKNTPSAKHVFNSKSQKSLFFSK